MFFLLVVFVFLILSLARLNPLLLRRDENENGMLMTTRYIQMSGMVLGSMIEADHSLREYEKTVRMRRRLVRDQAMWRDFEERYGKDEEDD